MIEIALQELRDDFIFRHATNQPDGPNSQPGAYLFGSVKESIKNGNATKTNRTAMRTSCTTMTWRRDEWKRQMPAITTPLKASCTQLVFAILYDISKVMMTTLSE